MSPLSRKTGLTSKTPLTAGKPLQRKTPIARQCDTPKPKAAKKKPAARYTGPAKKTKDMLAERSQGVCEICGQARAVDRHHRHGRQMGGTRRPWISRVSNLLHLCRRDHDMVTDTKGMRPEFEANGWLLREGQNPLDVPVLLAAHGWSRLDDCGGLTPSLPGVS